MSDTSNTTGGEDFFANAKEGGAPAPTDEQIAAYLARQNAGTTDAAGVVTPAKELTDSDYEFQSGEVVATETGFGIIISRGPTAANEAGYVVAGLGQANDLPATVETLGLKGI